MKHPTPNAPLLRLRPYYDARMHALEIELPLQAAQPRRVLLPPTELQQRLAREQHEAKKQRDERKP